MKIQNLLLGLIIVTFFLFCTNSRDIKHADVLVNNLPSDLEVDHLNMWVSNPQKAKGLFEKLGFKAVPDSLSSIHAGQGTSGRYFNFLNGYLELIFVYDQKELEENCLRNTALDFIERANFENNAASPFSIGLKVNDYQVGKIPFETIKYHQAWMDPNSNIYSAKNSKTHLAEPSIFVVYPEIESAQFESLIALENTPTEDSTWKEFFKHPNGVQRITDIIITSVELDLKTATLKTINEMKGIRIKNGKQHLMELFFDDNIQGKSFDLRPDLPIVINY